jgi:hypothetical protein
MEAQLASDQREFAGHAISSEPSIQEVQEVVAAWEDRERRRVEFRSSLRKARAGFSPVDDRQAVAQSVRQLSAEVRDRRPARMMAELVSAH